ncbi:MAG TPA: DNA methyltransferase [Sphingopyxis sp.]|nr:DNA methyltransferase [Sphingopyxis sp.]
MTNRLYYGDNLDVLREHIASESIDLIYLDPPFNSNANYNILFKSPAGKAADSQIEAFEDTWHWNDKAEAAFHDVMTSGNTDVAELLRAMRGFLKENDMMAYLAMMAVRLIELHRVLKPTGSLYLHCDPTASHYLKLLLDGVFGANNFKTEIIWKRTFAHGNVGRTYGDVTDTIFFYVKSDQYIWNQPYKQVIGAKLDKKYPNADPDGRRWQSVTLRNPGVRPNLHYPYEASNGVTYQPHPNGWSCNLERMQRYDREGRLHFPSKPDGALRLKMYQDESKGERLQSLWDDIPPISSQAQERLGYPTQKPLALLERIINASSNEGDVVLDPFCGCGTAVDAAQKLGRRWIGIDVTHLSIGLIERRMQDRYGDALDYEVIGTPNDTDSALKLAAEEPHQFQYWITQAIGGQPYQGGRKGADRGIDGYIYYTRTDAMQGKSSTEAAIISVKAGQRVGVAMVRDLKGGMEREKAEIGIFVCVIAPTREMEREAAAAGVYVDPGTQQTYPRLQIYTLAEYFAGLRPKVPMLNRQIGYKKAGRADPNEGRQGSLL